MKTTNGWFCAAGLLALPGLTGCGGSSSSNTSAQTLTPRSVSSTLSNGLTATLTEDRSVVSIGGTVTYTITLANNTAQPITYQPVYGPGNGPPVPAALEIVDPSGTLVYPVGPSAQIVTIGPSTTLAPRQSVSESQVVSTAHVTGLTIAAGYAHSGQYAATANFGLVTAPPQSTEASGSVGPLTVTAQ